MGGGKVRHAKAAAAAHALRHPPLRPQTAGQRGLLSRKITGPACEGNVRVECMFALARTLSSVKSMTPSLRHAAPPSHPPPANTDPPSPQRHHAACFAANNAQKPTKRSVPVQSGSITQFLRPAPVHGGGSGRHVRLGEQGGVKAASQGAGACERVGLRVKCGNM
eukprot:366426-Chlamydomonas_euryale.AAC.15